MLLRIVTLSACKGNGKKKPIQLLLKEKRFESGWMQLGKEWVVTEELLTMLEEFTCALYGRTKDKDVNKVRTDKLKEKCGINKLDPKKDFHIASLPPCRMALEQHIRKSNYQVGIWKRAHINNPEIPDPTEGHGWIKIDGCLEPCWVDGPILPQSIEQFLEPVSRMAGV